MFDMQLAATSRVVPSGSPAHCSSSMEEKSVVVVGEAWMLVVVVVMLVWYISHCLHCSSSLCVLT